MWVGACGAGMVIALGGWVGCADRVGSDHFEQLHQLRAWPDGVQVHIRVNVIETSCVHVILQYRWKEICRDECPELGALLAT